MPSRFRPSHLLTGCIGVLAFAGVACTPTPRPESRRDSSRGDTSRASAAPAPVDDRTRLAQLERDARALARVTGCDSAGACRVAPVGWRACGGPRDYVAYCAASTDTVALFAALERLKRAEMDYNAKSGMMSTCEMRLPPTPTLRAGSCTATR